MKQKVNIPVDFVTMSLGICLVLLALLRGLGNSINPVFISSFSVAAFCFTFSDFINYGEKFSWMPSSLIAFLVYLLQFIAVIFIMIVPVISLNYQIFTPEINDFATLTSLGLTITLIGLKNHNKVNRMLDSTMTDENLKN